MPTIVQPIWHNGYEWRAFNMNAQNVIIIIIYHYIKIIQTRTDL